MARPIATNLFESLMMDGWPRIGAICDFGIDTPAHYEALHYAVRRGGMTVEALDAVLGGGPRITAAVNAIEGNPHPGIVFTTVYDGMTDE